MVLAKNGAEPDYSCDKALLKEGSLIIEHGDGRHGKSHATFDRSLRHRFTLGRQWEEKRKIVSFCMLNPSTADAFRLDPTVTRCFGFATLWGAGGLIIVNLFSLRSPNPKDLRLSCEHGLTLNDDAIDNAVSVSDIFIVGWGNHGKYLSRAEIVLQRLRDRGAEVFRLGCLTRKGEPRHPLYLPKKEKLVPMW